MAATATTAVPTGTWNVDPSHSKVGFSVKHLGIATVRGDFKTFEGSLTVAQDGTVTAAGTVDASSVDTSEAARDEHLPERLRDPSPADLQTRGQTTQAGGQCPHCPRRSMREGQSRLMQKRGGKSDHEMPRAGRMGSVMLASVVHGEGWKRGLALTPLFSPLWGSPATQA